MEGPSPGGSPSHSGRGCLPCSSTGLIRALWWGGECGLWSRTGLGGDLGFSTSWLDQQLPLEPLWASSLVYSAEVLHAHSVWSLGWCTGEDRDRPALRDPGGGECHPLPLACPDCHPFQSLHLLFLFPLPEKFNSEPKCLPLMISGLGSDLASSDNSSCILPNSPLAPYSHHSLSSHLRFLSLKLLKVSELTLFIYSCVSVLSRSVVSDSWQPWRL